MLIGYMLIGLEGKGEALVRVHQRFFLIYWNDLTLKSSGIR